MINEKIYTQFKEYLNYLLVKYGLKVYKVGILNYSESGLWKKMFKAVKEK